MTKKFSPHFSRSFNAKFLGGFVRLGIWVVLVIFLLFSLSSGGTLPHFKQLSLATLQDYRNPQNHFNLAKEYLKVNDLENAKRELLIGLTFAPEDEELKKALAEVENRLGQPAQVKEEIQTWEKIAQDFPGYRDAYLKLTQLYFQIYQEDKARENLGESLKLDPNYEPTEEFQKILRDF